MHGRCCWLPLLRAPVLGEGEGLSLGVVGGAQVPGGWGGCGFLASNPKAAVRVLEAE